MVLDYATGMTAAWATSTQQPDWHYWRREKTTIHRNGDRCHDCGLGNLSGRNYIGVQIKAQGFVALL
jgi:hypothetical protein